VDIHYCFLRMQVALGGSNPVVLFFTRRLCRHTGVNLNVRDGALELIKGNRVMRIPFKHFGYAPSLAGRFDLYFSLVKPVTREGLSVVDYSVPRLQTLAVSGLQFEMSSFPEEEGAAAAYFRRYTPRAGDTIFDIGAHCGVSAYHFSKAVGPSGKVIAFEPDSLNHSLLLRNIQRHNLSNVTAVRAAIGGTRGQAAFNSEGTQGSGLSRHFGRPSFCKTEIVDVMTLDDAFNRWDVPDLCKIDIEGAEIETLAAARERLRRQRVPLALDTSHVVNGTRTQFEVERILKAIGYATESLEIDGFMNTWAIPNDPQAQHPE
jgi:FkbM family methyltransferase